MKVILTKDMENLGKSGDVVTVKLLTPFFDIPLPISFNAAAGIADHTVDNRPVQLANGYYIAPADPNGETLTGSTGFLPLFGAVQGNQKFNVYDSNNQPASEDSP